MNSLKRQVGDHYQSKKLSSDQLERLKEQRRPYFLWASLGSSLVACSILIIFLTMPGFNDSVMKEITYNHYKNLSVEVSTGDLSQIQSALPKLDFTIVQSSKFSRSEWQVMGGRYCSIQGQIAAQIKLKKIKTGQIYTFYQTRGREEFKSDLVKRTIDGATVEVWNEKGLLMGVAGP